MTKKTEAKTPFILKAMRSSISILTRVSPDLAARFANYLWFKTQRFPEPKREAMILEKARWETLDVDDKKIQIYIWGEDDRPAVLLVHGWNGRAGQLGSFALDLVEKGYRVVGFDSPAHGRSPGSSTTLPTISQVIQEIDRQYGSFQAGITHSFGGMCLMHAIGEGMKLDKVSCISPASDVSSLVKLFASILKIEPQVVTIQKRMLEQQFGEDIWEKFSIPNIVKTISTPGLIIHDQHDEDVPVVSGKLIARAWKGSEFVLTSKLGHRRILRDKGVIDRVISYIDDTSMLNKAT